jgi:hypothetical protein
MSLATAAHIYPPEIVRAAKTKRLEAFSNLYGDVRLLLVRLPTGTEELAEGLAATVSSHVAAPSPQPVLDFQTEVVEPVEFSRRPNGKQGGYDATILKARLGECPYFIVPLRKRVDEEALFAERISVGRARNKDVVLRHDTVSKFHGWFVFDKIKGMCFIDPGSKNGTRVNDRLIERRETVPLSAGDRVKLGSVEAIIGTADTLWTALQP